MTRTFRLHALACAFGLALCLVSSKPPQIVGDGGEYLVYAINFATLNGPSLRTRDLDRLKDEVRGYAPELEDETFYRNAVPGTGGRRDFMHFWFFSLIASPFVWVARAAGLPAVYGFVALNLALVLGAIWLALPRIGVAATVLLFASPLVWWLDKAHTEVFTVSLLTVVVLYARDKPWWAMVAAGVASTQYPHIGALVGLIAAVSVLFDRSRLRDRRFIVGTAAGLGIAILHPAYYYVRHGTPSLLFAASNIGTPTWAELSAIVIDPVIGLLPNFPVFAVVVGAAVIGLVMRQRRELLRADVVVTIATTVFFIWVFGQKDNVHHGATPSLSRYALWFIPLAIPFLRTERMGGVGWRRFMWASGIVSAVVCGFAFHPSVPQNGREPTWAARLIWEKHPAWHNPLPEVFTETYRKTEDPVAPTLTYGCEKVLLGGPGEKGTWPMPCYPPPVPVPCSSKGVWCYANRTARGYDFLRAPGRWNRTPVVDESEVWPRDIEDRVRAFYTEWEWWTMRQDVRRVSVLESSAWITVQALEADDRFILVLRDPGAQPRLTFRMPGVMRGVLFDPMTGQTLQSLQYSGPAGAAWELALPTQPNLMLLAMRR